MSDVPSLPPVEAIQRKLVKQLRCAHKNREGGNDYILCTDCGFAFDYRRQSIEQALIKAAADELEAAIPSPQTWQPLNDLRAFIVEAQTGTPKPSRRQTAAERNELLGVHGTLRVILGKIDELLMT